MDQLRLRLSINIL